MNKKEGKNSASKIHSGLAELKKKLSECEREKQEYLEGWKRIKADFSNARKEEERSRDEFRKYAEEKLLYELLELMDVFDQALLMQEDNGIQQLRKKLLDVLKRHGVHIINVKSGDMLDPTIHEAIQGEGEIIQHIAQNGYLIRKKLFRPARVIVSDEK